MLSLRLLAASAFSDACRSSESLEGTKNGLITACLMTYLAYVASGPMFRLRQSYRCLGLRRLYTSPGIAKRRSFV
jgi:hypothetical protein